MMVGRPLGFTVAMLLPCTSDCTVANFAASSRQTRAGADSKPDGPGVSSRRFRKVVDESLSMVTKGGEGGEDSCRAGRYLRASSKRHRDFNIGQPGDSCMARARGGRGKTIG